MNSNCLILFLELCAREFTTTSYTHKGIMSHDTVDGHRQRGPHTDDRAKFSGFNTQRIIGSYFFSTMGLEAF